MNVIYKEPNNGSRPSSRKSQRRSIPKQPSSLQIGLTAITLPNLKKTSPINSSRPLPKAQHTNVDERGASLSPKLVTDLSVSPITQDNSFGLDNQPRSQPSCGVGNSGSNKKDLPPLFSTSITPSFQPLDQRTSSSNLVMLHSDRSSPFFRVHSCFGSRISFKALNGSSSGIIQANTGPLRADKSKSDFVAKKFVDRNVKYAATKIVTYKQ
jgi:hypothetical protein